MWDLDKSVPASERGLHPERRRRKKRSRERRRAGRRGGLSSKTPPRAAATIDAVWRCHALYVPPETQSCVGVSTAKPA